MLEGISTSADWCQRSAHAVKRRAMRGGRESPGIVQAPRGQKHMGRAVHSWHLLPVPSYRPAGGGRWGCFLRGRSIHRARKPVPLQSPQGSVPFPSHIWQDVLRLGTSQSMLSPRTKKPVPRHQGHSPNPCARHVSHATGCGCLRMPQTCSRPFLKFSAFSCSPLGCITRARGVADGRLLDASKLVDRCLGAPLNRESLWPYTSW